MSGRDILLANEVNIQSRFLLLFHCVPSAGKLCDLRRHGSFLPVEVAGRSGAGAPGVGFISGAVHGSGAAARASATRSRRGAPRRCPRACGRESSSGGAGRANCGGGCSASCCPCPCPPRASRVGGRHGLSNKFSGMMVLPGKHNTNLLRIVMKAADIVKAKTAT